MTTLAPPPAASSTEASTTAPPADPAVAGAVVALGLREAWLLMRHPGVLVGIGLTVFAFMLASDEDSATVLSEDVAAFLPLLLLAWGALIAVNLATLRSRRDGTDELFDSLPTPAPARTAGHLLSVLALVPMSAVYFVAWFLISSSAPAAVGSPNLAVLAGGALMVVGAGVCGVLVARWVPTAAAGPVAVIATIVLQSNIGHQDYRWRWLHFASGDGFNFTFDVGHHGWHVVWLAGLVVLAVFLAFARHGLSRPVATAGGLALVLLVVSGWVQTRPLSESRLAARAAQLADPAAHQVCEQRGGVRYCAYPTYGEWISLWEASVRGVLSRVPAGAAPTGPLQVRQRPVPSAYDDLIPPLREKLDPKAVWAADNAVHPGMTWGHDDHPLVIAFQTASWAVGLPPAASWPSPHACSAGGQARAVTAMWLAGQSGPKADALLRKRAAEIEREAQRALLALQPLDVMPNYEGEDGIDAPYETEVGAAGRGADVVAAARLLALPTEKVAAMLKTNWGRIIDSKTPSSALFDLMELPTPAAIADQPPVVPGVGPSCP